VFPNFPSFCSARLSYGGDSTGNGGVTFPDWEPDSHVRFCTGCTNAFSVFKRKQ
jgi:hypothetical protein